MSILSKTMLGTLTALLLAANHTPLTKIAHASTLPIAQISLSIDNIGHSLINGKITHITVNEDVLSCPLSFVENYNTRQQMNTIS